MFKVGDRVVYVTRSFNALWLGWAREWPRYGAIYTVRAVMSDPHFLTREPGLGLWLEELHNPPTLDTGREPTFCVSHFRKAPPEAKSAGVIDAASAEHAGNPVALEVASAAIPEIVEMALARSGIEPVRQHEESGRTGLVRREVGAEGQRGVEVKLAHQRLQTRMLSTVGAEFAKHLLESLCTFVRRLCVLVCGVLSQLEVPSTPARVGPARPQLGH